MASSQNLDAEAMNQSFRLLPEIDSVAVQPVLELRLHLNDDSSRFAPGHGRM